MTGRCPRLEVSRDLTAVRPAWTELALGHGSIFSTWEWAQVWWAHFGSGEPRVVLCHTDGGELESILPLYIQRRRPIRLARFIGHGPADELGPIGQASDGRLAKALLAASDDPALRWDVLLLDNAPAGAGWARALGGRILRQESSPVIDIHGASWDDYLRSKSANFRSQVRRRERKLLEQHGLRYRLADDPSRLAEDMGSMFELHRARWGHQGSGAFDAGRASFHRKFAAVALERGWLRLWLAEIEERPVAAWYGFRFGGAEWYYQSGRDPSWDGLSIGSVLLAHTIRAAIEDGIGEYRLLRGGEPYKSRFANREAEVQTAAVAHGLAGRAAVVAGCAALALPAPLRRLAQTGR